MYQRNEPCLRKTVGIDRPGSLPRTCGETATYDSGHFDRVWTNLKLVGGP